MSANDPTELDSESPRHALCAPILAALAARALTPAELLVALPVLAGRFDLELEPNVILWPGFSSDAKAAIAEMIDAGELGVAQHSRDAHIRRAGSRLALPVTRDPLAVHCEPHWFPALLSARK